MMVMMKELTKPTAKLARVLFPLQARLVEEEARIAEADVDGHEIPFCIQITKTSAPLLLLSILSQTSSHLI